MSSSIYNHKHLQPTGASTQGPSGQQHSHAKLNECFETIKQEFDLVAHDLSHLRGQRDDLDSKVNGQVNELNIIRQSLYDLETQHGKIRVQYEQEIAALRAELHALRSQGREREVLGLASLGRDRDPALRPEPPLRGDPSMRGEPSRDRERDLMRERDVLRERERERDRERDRDGDIRMVPGPSAGIPVRGDAMGRDGLGMGRPSAVQGAGDGLPLTPVGLGMGAGPGGGGGGGGYEPFYGRQDRERERGGVVLSDRERGLMSERERMERERLERERERDSREVKRVKTERVKTDRTDPFSPSMNHPSAHPQHHQSIALGPSAAPPGPQPPASGPGPNPNPLATPTSTNPPVPSSRDGMSLSVNGRENGSSNMNPGATPKLPPTPGVGGMGMGVSLPPPPYAGQQGGAGIGPGSQPQDKGAGTGSGMQGQSQGGGPANQGSGQEPGMNGGGE